ncbi:nuclear factor 7, brain-like [Sardina pilchardus]|uniref:nuclear factor 7, brain-like n=1 Tax=Sardina pilchardus TaxID=27697 RepID=UPI002E0FB286
MAFSPSSLEDDLQCPVCCDLFADPVVLHCSHSFCRLCLDAYWKDQPSKPCPVCRRPFPGRTPPVNLALKNIVEVYKREQEEGADHKHTPGGRAGVRGQRERGEEERGEEEEEEGRCSQHGERLLLYCEVDQEPICMVCHLSKRHRGHRTSPVEEAAEELREEVRASLSKLQARFKTFNKVKQECARTAQYLETQASKTRAQIAEAFEELHHFLRLEENARMGQLEEEVELKTMIMKEKVENLIRKTEAMNNTISQVERELEARDSIFLQAYSKHQESLREKLAGPDPTLVTGALINVASHLGNLKFKVWEKMKENVEFCPVIFDPNTATPCLSVSDGLTSVHDVGHQPSVPLNPERFDRCVCVLGVEPLGPGTHIWEVEVGGREKWNLGVVAESSSRKGELQVHPANGYWALALRDGGRYSASTLPPRELSLKARPSAVRIILDHQQGELSFYNATDMALIYTFRDSFTERLLPFFSPGVMKKGTSVSKAIKVCKADIRVTLDP